MLKLIRNKYFIKITIILIFTAVYVFIGNYTQNSADTIMHNPLMRLSDAFFYSGMVCLCAALIIELVKRRYHKLFAYPVYYLVHSIKINRQKKAGEDYEKTLSPYEYEVRSPKSHENKSFYILALVTLALSALLAFLK